MNKRLGGLLTVVITSILLVIYYSSQISGAAHLTYGIWGDGYKNYYTLAYYLKYNSGTHFTGMNYPFGENVIFTDNQPAVAWILKGISWFFPAITHHVQAYIAYSFFIALLISALLVYKILLQFDIDAFNAAFFSVLITLLSPQIPRLGGHFSLSYSFYLPATIYLLIRFFKTDGQIKYFALLTALTSFFIFVHIYYAAISGMFILLVAACYTVVRFKDIKNHLRIPGLLGFAALFPVVLLKGYLLLYDKVNDRPAAPWGFIESRSTMADVLLHPFTFTGEIIGNIFPGVKIVYGAEGGGYIGLVTIITLLTGFIFYFILKRRKINLFVNLYPFQLFVIPAVCVLLFSMAFPFSIKAIAPYYAKMPSAIKQFRASGRFNWIFFYTSTILSCLLIYQLYRQLLTKNKVLACTLLVAVYSVWFIEDNMISNHISKNFRQISVTLMEDSCAHDLLKEIQKSGKQVSDFQAILPIPFFLNGSEKLYIESSSSYDAMKASLFTGLPIAGAQLSRSSLKQTFELANLLSDPLIKKDVLHLFNNKPLLIIYNNENLTPEETALLKKGKFIFANNNDSYYELDLSAFKDSIAETKNYFIENKNKFFAHNEYLSTDSSNDVFLKRFESEPKSYAIFGKGAHYNDSETCYLFDTLPGAKDSAEYNVSYWVYTDKRRAAYPVMYMSQIDSSGKTINKFDSNAKFSTNTYGDWVRSYFNFTLTKKSNKILLFSSGKFATFDEIMIRPKSENVITQFENDSTFIFNNFAIR